MELNDIKKLLYKHKPIANCYAKNSKGWLYDAIIDNIQVHFFVPLSEMGDLPFNDKEQSQLLIRYYNSFDIL